MSRDSVIPGNVYGSPVLYSELPSSVRFIWPRWHHQAYCLMVPCL